MENVILFAHVQTSYRLLMENYRIACSVHGNTCSKCLLMSHQYCFLLENPTLFAHRKTIGGLMDADAVSGGRLLCRSLLNTRLIIFFCK